MSGELGSLLLAAAAAGRSVRIIYRRGSQPGSVREIVPLSLVDGELRARDLAVGMEKTFKIEHIDLAGPQTDAPTYDPNGPTDVAMTILAAVERHVPALQQLGWHVEATENAVSVHRYFKNGKTRKGADVGIQFNEFSIDAFDDGYGEHEDRARSTRPYCVYSPRFDRAHSFARLPLAVVVFLEEANACAPSSILKSTQSSRETRKE